jgi:hypothetical protein
VATPAATERGFLLLADLSGYTAYLAGSDPTHGPLIAGDFIETIVGRLRGAFRLEKLEGDAVFLFAPVERVTGALVLDAVDAAYFGFQRRLQSVTQATTCDCEACRRIPQLDLKFICHVGNVLRQRIAGHAELAGRDVILAHRLLKGAAPQRADARSYLLFTDAAMLALDVDPAALGAIGLTERYGELGAINGHLLDLGRRWEDEQHARPPRPSGRPITRQERLLASEPAAAWDLLTSADQRVRWEGLASVDEGATGRRGVGATATCVAGRLRTIEEVIDWRPFDSFARRIRHPELGRLTAVVRLEAMGTGTDLEVTWFAAQRSERRGAESALTAFVAAQSRALDRLVVLAEREVSYDGGAEVPRPASATL